MEKIRFHLSGTDKTMLMIEEPYVSEFFVILFYEDGRGGWMLFWINIDRVGYFSLSSGTHVLYR